MIQDDLPLGVKKIDDGFCRALIGSNRRGNGPEPRTERCRYLLIDRHGKEKIGLCRIHEQTHVRHERSGIKLLHEYIAPDWWMWPEDLLAHVASLLRRTGVERVEILISNLARRIG